MDALKAVAAASGISVSQYLKGNFGAGVTEKVYGEQLMRVLRYSAYADAYQRFRIGLRALGVRVGQLNAQHGGSGGVDGLAF